MDYCYIAQTATACPQALVVREDAFQIKLIFRYLILYEDHCPTSNHVLKNSESLTFKNNNIQVRNFCGFMHMCILTFLSLRHSGTDLPLSCLETVPAEKKHSQNSSCVPYVQIVLFCFNTLPSEGSY